MDNRIIANIRAKTMLVVLPLLIAILVMISWISYHYSYIIIERELDNQMAARLQATLQSFRTELTAHRTIGETLARIAEKSKESISKQQYALYLQNIIHTNSHTLGAGIWYEPFRYHSNVRYFGPYVYKSKGQYIYTEEYETPEYDFPNQDWYKSATHTKKPVVWTDPYYDELTQITMITASMPFYDENGRLKGMATADMDLSELQEITSSVKVGEQGWAFLLSADGTYISDRNNQKVMKMKISDEAQSALAAVGKEIIANKSGKTVYQGSNDSYRVYYEELPETGWLLALVMPESELHAELNALLLKQSIVAVCAILLVISVIFVYARFITKIINERQQVEEKLEQKNMELKEAYSELANAHSQVIQQEKMASIGQLAAGVAHEINNPMAYIINNINSLKGYMGKISNFINKVEETAKELLDEADLDRSAKEIIGSFSNKIKANKQVLKIDFIISDTQELIDETLDGAGRVKNIVQDLKGFARMANEDAFVNLNDGIESTINIIWNEIKYKAKLVKELGELPLTKCNPGQMNQVFMNLLVNAAQAIDIQGEIRIKTWAEDARIFVTVSDTGGGIPPELINRIFEPFFTTKDIGKGTGLGLSVSYDIIKKHDGTISVESEVGKGTTFTVTIPVVNQ